MPWGCSDDVTLGVESAVTARAGTTRAGAGLESEDRRSGGRRVAPSGGCERLAAVGADEAIADSDSSATGAISVARVPGKRSVKRRPIADAKSLLRRPTAEPSSGATKKSAPNPKNKPAIVEQARIVVRPGPTGVSLANGWSMRVTRLHEIAASRAAWTSDS